MKPVLACFLGLSLSLSVLGCATKKVKYQTPGTTQETVFERFGLPLQKGMVEGYEVWTYRDKDKRFCDVIFKDRVVAAKPSCIDTDESLALKEREAIRWQRISEKLKEMGEAPPHSWGQAYLDQQRQR